MKSQNKFTSIEISETTHDFKQLKAGETVIYSFSVKNTGDSELLITDLITDCGCLKASFNQKNLSTGNTGYIDVEFNTGGLFGRQLKTIEIHANIKEIKYLTIFAEVINEQFEIKY